MGFLDEEPIELSSIAGETTALQQYRDQHQTLMSLAKTQFPTAPVSYG